VKVEDGKITDITVKRGAPCGATWEAALRVVNMAAEESIIRMGLETQFFCTADPAGWDPIYGKSPVHFAGDVHAAALKRAINHHDH
jgi:thymidylate synthase